MVNTDPTTDERIAHIRTLLAECTDLANQLDAALSHAEKNFPPPSTAVTVANFAGT